MIISNVRTLVKYRIQNYIKLILLFFLMWMPCLQAFDNAHFYRAPYFWGEPRYERSKLSTWQAYFGWAFAHTGRNSNGKKTNILDIYGPVNAHNLAAGVTTLDPEQSTVDKILVDLNSVTGKSKDFGRLKFTGQFHSFEILLEAYQNICNGFFVHMVIPIRKLKINNIAYTDLTPRNEESNPAWQNFRRNMKLIFAAHGISIAPFDKMGLGDITLTGGWACNYEDTETLDFIDIDARIGILFPTGQAKNEHIVFSLPLGYNKHWGVPVTFNSSVGLWDWLTAGFHISALFLVDRTYNVRVKTDPLQNGVIRLALTRANVDPGSLLNIQLYGKADHITNGLSAFFVYHFNYREPTTIVPKNGSYNNSVIGSDLEYHSWRMHSLQFGLEFDYTTELKDIGPRLALFYNHVLKGKRIYNADLKNSYIGIDLAWCY